MLTNRRPGVGLLRRAGWVLPAVAAAVATGYLAWGAWISAHDPEWLYRSPAWWRVWLRPAHDQALLVVVALWLVCWLWYWWPRRLQPQTVGLTTVVGMVLIGAVLASAALVPCRGRQSISAAAAWLLGLYVGNPPSVYGTNTCPGNPPLALQLGETVCLAATLLGAIAAAAVLWRDAFGRLRARFVSDATVFTGLDAMTIPLLYQLAEAGRPASIVVIEPDSSHSLLDEARATGARILIGQPGSARVLLPVLAGRRGCALRRLYALRPDVAENEAILTAAASILRRYQPDPERQPHLVARIDDPRHADHWRGRHVGTSSRWFEDALCAPESTARALADRLAGIGAGRLLLCGDSTVALAIVRELARRAWEQQQLAAAAARGRAAHQDATALNGAAPEAPPPAPPHVLLLDQRAPDLRREYLATSPPPIVAALPKVRVQAADWTRQLLAMLDTMPAAEAADTAVVIADAMSERSIYEGGRVARLHPNVPIFVLTSDGAGTTGAIFDRLHPFQRAFLVNGAIPEDSWTRVARHWHECYRLSHPPVPGEPRTLTGLPWAELDEFIRQDNILQLRSIMTAVVARDRQWVPARAVTRGSFIELTEHDLAEVARTEHTRWYQRRLATGWPGGSRPGSSGSVPPGAQVNRRVVPWGDLPASDRTAAIELVRSQLMQLEQVGFMPVVPKGGPDRAGEYERIGTVRARRLHAYRRWIRMSGDELRGAPGDWRVIDEGGDERTVRDPEFQASHEPVAGEVWRRVGTFKAWRVTERVVLRTMEGRAVARTGDWVVEGPGGERWPVTDRQFRRTYRSGTAPS